MGSGLENAELEERAKPEQLQRRPAGFRGNSLKCRVQGETDERGLRSIVKGLKSEGSLLGTTHLLLSSLCSALNGKVRFRVTSVGSGQERQKR